MRYILRKVCQIGIDVSTDLIEWSVFLQERVDKGDFDALEALAITKLPEVEADLAAAEGTETVVEEVETE